jgi:hypothetical protein
MAWLVPTIDHDPVLAGMAGMIPGTSLGDGHDDKPITQRQKA